jgi:hypothetical protein
LAAALKGAVAGERNARGIEAGIAADVYVQEVAGTGHS